MRAPRGGKPRRGVALLVVLLLMIVLFCMAKALVVLSKNQAFQSRGYYERTAALYVVEAAVADAQVELESDPDWRAGFQDKTLSDVPGSYTVVFNTGGLEVQPFESVNNLAGEASVDGPRGPGTVPPHTVELVISAHCAGIERRVQVLVSKKEQKVLPYGVTSSRNVWLQGNVAIDGIKSLESLAEVEAGIHSNRADDTSRIVTWARNLPGDRADITGKISVVSSAPGAIDFGADPGAYSVGGFSPGAPQEPLPTDDIRAEIAAHASAPAPTVATFGTTRVSGGDYYFRGDLTIQGDLELESSNLFVDGNLKVNGSISGNGGGVFVAGTTDFQGDSELRTNNEYGVALYSHGSLRLTGFKGTEYLETLADSNPQAAVYLRDTQDSVRDLQTLVATYPLSEFMPGGAAYDAAGQQQMVLGSHCSAPILTGRTRAAPGKLAALLEGQPPSSARDFLIRRLGDIERTFYCTDDAAGPGPPLNPPGTTFAQVVSDWENGTGNLAGIGVSVSATGRFDLAPQMAHYIDQMDYDKLGTAYFQGLIYTNGYLYAADEVDILGAVWAKDDGTQPGATIDSAALEPGDIYLASGTRLTLNEDYVLKKGGPAVAGRLKTQVWMER